MPNKTRNGAAETVEQLAEPATERSETDIRDMASILEDTVDIADAQAAAQTIPAEEAIEEAEEGIPTGRRRLLRSRRTLMAIIVGAVAVGVLAGMVLRRRAGRDEEDLEETD